jgi:hypothetical protein
LVLYLSAISFTYCSAFAFEKLKKKLMDEGLFDNKYKKPIPQFPTKIVVVVQVLQMIMLKNIKV